MKTPKKTKQTKKLNEKISLDAFVVYCPYLDHQVMVPRKMISLDMSDSPCDCCGSHGHVTISFTCDCGLYHSIILESW